MTEDGEARPGPTARRLIRSLDRASLATSIDGWPYASLVLAAADQDATPLLLVSRLAQHTQNLEKDGRASLLFDGTAGLDDPLTGDRVTVLGRAERTGDPRAKARFLARHPSAQLYAGFDDFALWRLHVERAHLVAGFGRIHWIERTDLLGATAPALQQAEADIVQHMNEDHADAIELFATQLLGRTGEGWRLTGIDPAGADLRRAGEIARLDFAGPVLDASGARAEFVRLVSEARRRS
jgi:hypothetical protein